MAGFCDWFENERRFVILTIIANESMIKVYDRMLMERHLSKKPEEVPIKSYQGTEEADTERY